MKKAKGLEKGKLRIIEGSLIRMKFKGRFARIIEELKADDVEGAGKKNRNSEDEKKEVDKKEEKKMRILTKY
jgi:hypothetical protein